MGKGGCDAQCVKYLMFFFNALFLICGLVILAVGLWVRFDKDLNDHLDDEAADLLYSGAYVIIAFGAFIVVVTFLGCCGAIRQSQCMLVTFFLILLVILVALVAAGVYVLVEQDDVKKELEKFYKDDSHDHNATEKALDCCAGSGCCEGSGCRPLCYDVVWEEAKERAPIIGGIALGIAFVIVLGMIFSMMLCCSVKNERYAV